MSDYDSFYNNLRASGQKNILNDILEILLIEKEDVIKIEIEKDLKHLEIVNFCANLFKPYVELNIKNFDIGIYNAISNVLILIEGKSSFSIHPDKITKIKEAIDSTEKNIDKLESVIGDVIKKIEYVYCLPSNDAIDLGKEVYSQNIPICVWCYDGQSGEIKLYAYPEETNSDGIQNGRLHGDEKLLRFLANGVKSTFRSLRSFSFLPSSHVYTILLDVIMTLVRAMSRYGEWDGYFDFIDIYEIINKNIAQPNTYNDSDIRELVENVLNIGIVKELISDSTPSIVEKVNKKYKLNNKAIRVRAIKQVVDENYIGLNAIKLAKRDAIIKFKEETGYKDMTDYIQ